VSVSSATFAGVAVSPNGCWVYAADTANSRLVPVSTATNTEGTPVSTPAAPYDIATASPPSTYYYEVQATRSLWTSPASGSASLSFGQPTYSN